MVPDLQSNRRGSHRAAWNDTEMMVDSSARDIIIVKTGEETTKRQVTWSMGEVLNSVSLTPQFMVNY